MNIMNLLTTLRSLVKRSVLMLPLLGFLSSVAYATEGTWTNTITGGLWSNPGNWSGGNVADGTGATANFNTLDLTADNTVKLDEPYTLNRLIFGDIVTGTAYGWVLTNNAVPANILTLGGTTPAITVNTLGGTKTVAIGTVIAGSAGLTKEGAGTLTLNGSAVNTFTGGLTLNCGTLAEDFSTLTPPTNLINTGNDLTFNGGIMTIKGHATATLSSQTFGNVTVNAGGGSLLATTGANLKTNSVSLGTITASASGGSLVLGAGSTSGVNMFSTTSDKDGQGIYGGRIIWANGTGDTGYDWATTVSGSSPYKMSPYSAYSTMVAGAMSDSLNDITASLTLTGVHTHNSLKITSGGALALGGYSLTLTSGGLLSVGTSGNTISGSGTVTAGSGSGYNLIVHQYNSTGLTISSPIVDNGANPVALVKSGIRTLTLSGANTYSAGTYINAGTLTLASGVPGAIGTGPITINSGATLSVDRNSLNRALTLNGGTFKILGGTTDGVWGTIALTANSTIDFTQSNFSVNTINSSISGAGGLTKTGVGVLIFSSSSNNYSGPTVISQGGIRVKSSLYGNDTSKWIPSNIIVATNAVLGLYVGGAGEFTMGQVATMFANLTTNVNNNGLLPGAMPTIYTVNAPAGLYTYSAVLADSTGIGGGSVNFKFFGTGNTTLELTGANTYSGVTMIENNGTLRVSSLNSVLTNPGLGTVHSASSSLGAPTTVANGTIWLGAGGWNGNSTLDTTYQGANLTYIGPGETTDRVLNIAGANNTTYTIDQSGSGLLKFVSAITATEYRGPKTFVLTGSTTGTGEFAGVIPNIDAANPSRLTKNGTGTWTLSGTNLYSGVTTINGGLLRVNGVITNGSAVTVAKSGAIGGVGIIRGVVTNAVGDASNPGGAINLADGIIGTLTLGSNLTFSGTAAFPNNLYFDLGNAAGGADKIIVSGTQSVSTANSVLVNLNQLPGAVINPGTYILIQGGTSSTLTGYTLANNRAGRNFYTLGTSGNTNLQVTVAAGDAGDSIEAVYWKGNSSSLWTGANWWADAAGTIATNGPGYSSNIRFAAAGAGNLINSLGQNYEINSLTVNAGLGAVNITNANYMLTIDATADNGNVAGNGITVSNALGTTIATKVGLASNQTWTVGSGAALTVSGAITDFGGASSLTKAGPGTLTLSGLNVYSGGTRLSGGTLTLANRNGLGTGTVTLDGGTVFQQSTFEGNSASGAFPNTFVLSGGSATFNVTFSLKDIWLNTPVSGPGNLRITSDTDSNGRTLTLDGPKTFTGGVTLVNNRAQLQISNIASLGTGTLESQQTGGSPLGRAGLLFLADLSGGDGVTNAISITSGSYLVLGGSVNAKLSGPISGAGRLYNIGSAIVTLSGENSYTGGTTNNSGTLTFLKTSAQPASGTTYVAASATLGLGVGGTGYFSSVDVDSLFANTLANVNMNAAALVGIDTTMGDFTYASSVPSTTLGLAKLGGRTLTLTGANSYSGPAAVRQGVLNIQNGGALGTPAAGTTVSSGTALQLQGDITVGAEALSLNGTGLSSDGALRNINGANVWQGTVTLAGATRINSDAGSLTFNTAATSITGTQNLTLGGSGNGTVGGKITTATGTFTKDGMGTWTLSGLNTYSGATAVNGGTLKVGIASVVGVGGPLGTNSAVTLANTAGVVLDLNGYNTDIGSLAGGGTSGGNVTLGSATLTVGTNNTSTAFAGVISGTGSFVKVGTGTNTLSGTSTYSGNTTINVGVLALTTSASMGNTETLTIANGAKMNLATGINPTVTYLTLGGKARAKGTWGSTTSSATNKDDTYFVGSGMVTVSKGAQIGTIVSFR